MLLISLDIATKSIIVSGVVMDADKVLESSQIAGAEEFYRICDVLTDSHYIQSIKQIRDVMVTISRSPGIMRVIKSCLRGYDFLYEFKNLLVPVSSNRYNLQMPASRESFVAFAFTLLYKIDETEIDLAAFLYDYYYDDDYGVNKSYREFCADIFPKFKRCIYSLLSGTADPVTKTVERRLINTDKSMEAVGVIEEAISYITSESAFMLDEKEEMLLVSQGLIDALSSRDSMAIRAMYIGYKNTLGVYPTCSKYVSAVYGYLKKYGII